MGKRRNLHPAGRGYTHPARMAVKLLSGSCLCGAVRYQVPDEFRYSLICHCSQCRRATGSAFKPFAGIEREKLQLISGQDATMRHGGSSTYDLHCARCGSLLYSDIGSSAYVHVTLGTLVDSPSIRPSAHIFVGSRAPWEQITDDLPQHAEFPPR
jgi:hypothetical protein